MSGPGGPRSGEKSPVLVRLVEGLLLVARGFLLVLGLPVVVRHAVDDLARLGIGNVDALLACLLAATARPPDPACRSTTALPSNDGALPRGSWTRSNRSSSRRPAWSFSTNAS